MKNKILLLDYICYALFSSVSGLFLILPLFFHDAFHFSYMRATSLVTIYLIGHAVGVLTYVRIIRYAMEHWHWKNISVPRVLLLLSALAAVVLLLLIQSNQSYVLLSIIMFVFGLVTCVFPTLNVAILNGNTYKKDTVKHASLQRWFQNIGMILSYGLFWANASKGGAIFYELAIVLCIAIFIECLLMWKPMKIPSVSPEKMNRESIEKRTSTFFLMALFSLVVFMQIPNVYAYYLHDAYHIGASYFSGLLVLNCAIVVSTQIPLSRYVLCCVSKSKSAALGMCLIAVGTGLPLFHHMVFVYGSFIAWTLGEIFLFTSLKAYLMEYSNHDAKHNLSITTRYYTLYYLSSLVCPFVIQYVYRSFSAVFALMGLTGLAVVVGFGWVFL